MAPTLHRMDALPQPDPPTLILNSNHQPPAQRMIPRRIFLGSLLGASASTVLGRPPNRIRIAQIGTEHAHASGKLEAIRHLTEFYDVLGFSSPKSAPGKAYGGLPHLSEEELLTLPGLQAVTVETRIEDSCAAALRAIRAGKHVHLDKPGAVVHAEFKAMREEAEKRGITVQMGYMLRANPAFQWLFQAVREGWLGDILEIDAMMGKLADPNTRHTIGALEGGGMFELACHIIDAAVTLLGKPSEVVARSTPSQADHVKDNQIALLVYPKATVTIRCNHADPFGGPRRRFTVSGTQGCVEIQPLESGEFTLSLTKPQGSWKTGTQKVKLPLPRARYDEEFVELAKVVRHEKTYAWNAAHDVAVHETVLRAAGLTV